MRPVYGPLDQEENRYAKVDVNTGLFRKGP